MTKQSLKRWLSASSLALAGVFAAIPASQAAVVVSFDPAYGAGIPNLGFKGTATLDVNSNCVGGSSGFGYGYVTASVLASEGCFINVQSFHIDFYNTTLGAGSVFSTIDRINTPETRLIINEVYFDTAGELAGVGTTDSSIFAVNLQDTQPESGNSISFSGFMALYFESGYVLPSAGVGFVSDPGLAAGTPGVGGARLTTCTELDARSDICSHVTTSNLATPTFTTVPEPGSLALVGAALAGLGFARRRAAR